VDETFEKEIIELIGQDIENNINKLFYCIIMGWFHKNLKELRATLSEIESEPSVENITRFHSEVDEKLKVLKSELQHTTYLMSTGQIISQKLSAIESTFEKMLFQKGDVKGLSRKALKGEMGLFGKKMDEISIALDWIRKTIGPLEKAVELVKIEEKEEER